TRGLSPGGQLNGPSEGLRRDPSRKRYSPLSPGTTLFLNAFAGSRSPGPGGYGARSVAGDAGGRRGNSSGGRITPKHGGRVFSCQSVRVVPLVQKEWSSPASADR